MFEIMSLPPVEEVARKAQDGKINEKKLKRLRSFGEGSKREWWVQNMKGEVRKQRSVSSEAAVRTLMEVNGKTHFEFQIHKGHRLPLRGHRNLATYPLFLRVQTSSSILWMKKNCTYDTAC